MKNTERTINGSVVGSDRSLAADVTDYGYQMLAAAIVVQAIKDYRLAVKKNDIEGKDGVKAIREFFSSAWCESLVSVGTGIDCMFQAGEFTSMVDKMLAV